ncbi:hypothetical protein ACFQY0_01520 [Haloferula chungangensis]|uniref:Zonadhesin n=1 Tax=Haloferula chungangensis TaxID=1048331 RepID=A0ABW2L2P4_9BACT
MSFFQDIYRDALAVPRVEPKQTGIPAELETLVQSSPTPPTVGEPTERTIPSNDPPRHPTTQVDRPSSALDAPETDPEERQVIETISKRSVIRDSESETALPPEPETLSETIYKDREITHEIPVEVAKNIISKEPAAEKISTITEEKALPTEAHELPVEHIDKSTIEPTPRESEQVIPTHSLEEVERPETPTSIPTTPSPEVIERTLPPQVASERDALKEAPATAIEHLPATPAQATRPALPPASEAPQPATRSPRVTIGQIDIIIQPDQARKPAPAPTTTPIPWHQKTL